MDSQNENLDIGRMDGIDISKMEEVAASDNLAGMNVETERKMEGSNSCPAIAMDADDGSECFLCVICLELVYKPIVQSCGHLFCFWCVHQAMNHDTESYCPLCRSPYTHFPRVCELLHFVLFKAFPEHYRQRAEEVLEQERTLGVFSPQFGDPPIAKITDDSKLNSSETTANFPERESSQEDSLSESNVATKCMDSIFSSGPIRNGTESMHASSLHHECVSVNVETSVSINSLEANDGPESVASKTTNGQANAPSLISFNKVTMEDALCCYCKRLLYHPTVLNCGHVFCQSCIKTSEEITLNCQVCQNIHPGDQPCVCLQLHRFLEQTFPVEYAERKQSVLVQEKMHQPRCVEFVEHDGAVLCLDVGYQNNILVSGSEDGTKEAKRAIAEISEVHAGAGCDYCGVMPIVGKRYKCLDCRESIGFDLCGTCYEKGSMLPGRFNQQHTSEHRLQEVHISAHSFQEITIRYQEYLTHLYPVLINQLSRTSSIIQMGEEDSESSMIHNSAESSEHSERNQTESDED